MLHLRRRLLTIPVVVLALPVVLVVSPFALCSLTIFDAVTGRRDLPTTRLWVFAMVFIAHEWLVLPMAFGLWIQGRFGRSLDLDIHRRLQGWWAGSLLTWARRLLAVEIDWPDLATMPPGTVVVLSRHASMIDAILPAYLFPALLVRPVHYVLKRELRWVPSIDIFGHRLGNHFIDRDGKTEQEVAGIARLAERAQPGSAIVIFPEGTYATPASRARIHRSLERRGASELVALADELRTLLPPRPAGTLALLEHTDDAPVIIFGHVGMEGVAEFRGLRANLPATHPIVVRWWVHDRKGVPSSPEEQTTWLHDQWRRLDQWATELRPD